MEGPHLYVVLLFFSYLPKYEISHNTILRNSPFIGKFWPFIDFDVLSWLKVFIFVAPEKQLILIRRHIFFIGKATYSEKINPC